MGWAGTSDVNGIISRLRQEEIEKDKSHVGCHHHDSDAAVQPAQGTTMCSAAQDVDARMRGVGARLGRQRL